MIHRLMLVATVVALLGAPAWAADRENTAVKPSKKDESRHEGFLKIAKKGDIDVVFYGDSITDGWNGAGKDVWKDKFAPLKAVDFGIGGDRTQHLLWRMQNGELEGYKAKVMVLMIGTNNLGANTNEEIADGIKAVVEEFQKNQPKAKVLLLGIFPRGEMATDKNRDRIKDINKIIAKMDDGKKVKYMDIGDKFLEKDGTISKEIMPDFLHLSPKGYGIWGDAVEPVLKGMLK
jgi:lysophospholipase L1-like esterase